AQQWQELFVTEKPPMRQGNENTVLAPAGLYETKDGEYMSIAILREEHWHKLCSALELGELQNHEKFSSNILRLENREALESIIIPIFKSKTLKDWLKYLSDHDILVAPVNNLAQIQKNERYMSGIPLIDIPENEFTNTYGKAGEKSVALPIQFNNNQKQVARYGPPKRGEHTDEIMKELGYNKEKVASFKKHNVIF